MFEWIFLSFQLEDVNVALEGERSKFAALDKKQKKFDQSFAEEKAVSERLLCDPYKLESSVVSVVAFSLFPWFALPFCLSSCIFTVPGHNVSGYSLWPIWLFNSLS